MEWLANLSVKWVLVVAAALLLLRAGLRRSPPGLETRAIREFVEAALIALVLVFLGVRPFLAQAYFIPSGSMHPTLWEADRVLVNKALYRLRPPRRGEIAVFHPPKDPRVVPSKDYIKRVIGLPGDELEVVPRRLLADGRTVMRLTREPASELRRQSFRPGADVGFLYPLEDGGVILDDDGALITSRLDPSLRVATYRDGDVIEELPTAVYRNNQALVAVALGTLARSHDLAQWGGDPGLQASVYSVEGRPRLVLVKGLRLSLDDGHVRVNGRRLNEPYVTETPDYPMPPYRVPAGRYFMMGDNRPSSQDSHVWGPLPAGRLVGRAEILFWPPGRWRLLAPPP